MKTYRNLTLLFALLVLVSCGSTSNITSSERDGSSFEKAIVVNSIAEEYEYVRKVCPKCQMVRQSLTSNNSKPYDVLEFKRADGSKALYYFDISKFF